MSIYSKVFSFDRNHNTISFKGDIIVDMSLVPPVAKAKIYSGLNEDCDGIDTAFSVTESTSPFNLQITSLSATGLIKALVENCLQVEGMVVKKKIDEAYIFLDQSISLH